MPEEIKVSRPPVTQPGQPMARPEQSPVTSPSKMPWIILGVIVLVLIVLGILFREKLFKSSDSKTDTQQSASANSGYQAVFLTNGQVYFGKLSQAGTDYPVLTDIYYLQVVQPPLQGQQSSATTGSATTPDQQSQISLVKLGNELHGPADEMHISKQQILFYEDLKTDGQVVKAIQSYKANPTGTPAVPSK